MNASIHPQLVAVLENAPGDDQTLLVNAVLDKLIELTPSVRTFEELTRIRGEVDA